MFRSTSDFSQPSSRQPKIPKWGSETFQSWPRGTPAKAPGALNPQSASFVSQSSRTLLDYADANAGGESTWRRNYVSIQELSDKNVDRVHPNMFLVTNLAWLGDP